MVLKKKKKTKTIELMTQFECKHDELYHWSQSNVRPFEMMIATTTIGTATKVIDNIATIKAMQLHIHSTLSIRSMSRTTNRKKKT